MLHPHTHETAATPTDPSPDAEGKARCSADDYAYLREFVLEQSVDGMDPLRNQLFDTRLSVIARSAGASHLADLVNRLRIDRADHLQRAAAEALSIHETSFFRDVRPFEAIRTAILPGLLFERRHRRTLRLWSAACSTGQETYSLAMLLLEHFPELAQWDVKIIGSDLSKRVVDYARRGRYRRHEINRGLPARMLLKFFERDGEEWQVLPQVKQLCEFRTLNLCTPLPTLPRFDLVLLRNVLLQLPPPEHGRIFTGICRQMQPDGILLLGSAEQAEDCTDRFRTESSNDLSLYRPAHPLRT